MRNSGSSNIYLSQVANSVIEGNVATGSGAPPRYLANGGSDDTVLRGNRCSGNAKNGIHFNGDSSVGGDGLHSGLVIDGNVLFQNVANGLDMDGVERSIIQNNVIYTTAAMQCVDSRSMASGPADLTIVNNTLSVPNGGGWAIKLTEDGGGHVILIMSRWPPAGPVAALPWTMERSAVSPPMSCRIASRSMGMRRRSVWRRGAVLAAIRRRP